MADKKPSSGDVLRALAEEARAGNIHPDRAAVLDAYLDDDSDQQPDTTDTGSGAGGDESKANTSDESPSRTSGQKESSTTAPDAPGGSSRKAGK